MHLGIRILMKPSVYFVLNLSVKRKIYKAIKIIYNICILKSDARYVARKMEMANKLGNILQMSISTLTFYMVHWSLLLSSFKLSRT